MMTERHRVRLRILILENDIERDLARALKRRQSLNQRIATLRRCAREVEAIDRRLSGK